MTINHDPSSGIPTNGDYSSLNTIGRTIALPKGQMTQILEENITINKNIESQSHRVH